MSVRIAVAQMDVVPDDVEGNRHKALALLVEGVAKRADIVLFPEGMLTGYGPRFKDLAEPADGPTAKAALRRGHRGRVVQHVGHCGLLAEAPTTPFAWRPARCPARSKWSGSNQLPGASSKWR